MRLSAIISTVIHLTPEQIMFQVIKRIHTPKFQLTQHPDTVCFKHSTHPIPKPVSLSGSIFTFLNVSSGLIAWDDDSNGPLWAYNLNYMDWIGQPGITPDECALWIDRFISDLPENSVGLAPYPTALRCINWIKFFCDNRSYATPERINHLYSQLLLLSRKTERDIGGNHLLEDAFALTIGASFFGDRKMARKANCILSRELKRQILPDGAHYEQSPMYHCILLDRLLDCINYTSCHSQDSLFPAGFNSLLIRYAVLMTGHLRSIVWPDGTIPLLNDSAYGIAPQYSELLDYAGSLGVQSAPIPMKECGYRRLTNGRIDAIVDIGNITAGNQPGHSHADTFNYELRIDGKPFIIDTGLSTYNKDSRRQYERSTNAHNTVIYDNSDSSVVWGGFRVAGRADVRITTDDKNRIEAVHNGFGNRHKHYRSFFMSDNSLVINDRCKGKRTTVSMIHFAPGISILDFGSTGIVTENVTITLQGALDVSVFNEKASVSYNRFDTVCVAQITFKDSLEQTIRIKP